MIKAGLHVCPRRFFVSGLGGGVQFNRVVTFCGSSNPVARLCRFTAGVMRLGGRSAVPLPVAVQLSRGFHFGKPDAVLLKNRFDYFIQIWIFPVGFHGVQASAGKRNFFRD